MNEIKEPRTDSFRVRGTVLELAWKENQFQELVIVKVKEENGDRGLGVIQHHEGKGWSIIKIDTPSDASRTLPYDLLACFEDARRAAGALLFIHETIQANPLSDDLQQYLTERWQEMKTRRQGLTAQLHANERDRRFLSMLAKQHKLDFWFDDTDVKAEVKHLIEFLGNDMNAIHERFGKDWARTLKSMIARVVRLVDPNAAKDI